MKIGELASATGVQIPTIRFYEQEGLLPPAARTAGNYRRYDESHVQRLAFVRNCRSLDIGLDDIRSLLQLKDRQREPCGEVNELLDKHILQLVKRIEELKALEGQLIALRAQCCSGQVIELCGILDGLSSALQSPVPRML
ncbi:Cd(II)/Pb(II)-responsive transcriptional regulator [Comamonas sp. E6]|uniref:Cd(II)/Pb(II)-responsive transcriptional regulator n=1 Tax=Comamonas sp. E6 TaxID=364029 RepID=UPI000750849D|nr:Cd(II)/Pb(II)-responsive transcriptional regulator [Comamonas sp. E6]